MLESIRIRNLGVIVDAHIEVGAGLTVLTGETGAGKTMVLTALNAMLGGRTDAGLIRDGASHADVEATWVLPADGFEVLRDRLDEIDADVDDDGDVWAVVVSRKLAAQGRSKSTLGGRSVAGATLQEVIEPLVAVHGQADQWRLLRSNEQRAILDAFGDVDIAAYRERYRTWRAAVRALEEFDADVARQGVELEGLRAGVAAIDAVEPVDGEVEDLDRLANMLSHAVMIAEAAEEMRRALTDDESHTAEMSLGMALRAADRIVGVDTAFGSVRDLVAQAQVSVHEAISALGAYLADVGADPQRLQQVEERRRVLKQVLRTYGPTVAEVLAWREQARDRLAHLADPEAHRAELAGQAEAAWQMVLQASSALSAARAEAAERLAAQVTEELQSLAMAGSALVVELVPHAGGLTETGAEEVRFGLQNHRGGSARPLAKGASGGELARVMLAIEVVVAGGTSVPTFVFDEVDAGVGGRAAIEVGRRLAALARRAQVLVVTHLPQVAAFADTHIVVRKDASGSVGTSDVVAVVDTDRVTELVRMLSGLPDSDVGAEHAKELLELAERARIAS